MRIRNFNLNEEDKTKKGYIAGVYIECTSEEEYDIVGKLIPEEIDRLWLSVDSFESNEWYVGIREYFTTQAEALEAMKVIRKGLKEVLK